MTATSYLTLTLMCLMACACRVREESKALASDQGGPAQFETPTLNFCGRIFMDPTVGPELRFANYEGPNPEQAPLVVGLHYEPYRVAGSGGKGGDLFWKFSEEFFEETDTGARFKPDVAKAGFFIEGRFLDGPRVPVLRGPPSNIELTLAKNVHVQLVSYQKVTRQDCPTIEGGH